MNGNLLQSYFKNYHPFFENLKILRLCSGSLQYYINSTENPNTPTLPKLIQALL